MSGDFEKDKESLNVKKYSKVVKLENMSFNDLKALDDLLTERKIDFEVVMMNIAEEGE